MDWILVEQCTPEDEQRCVVFTEDGDYLTARYNEVDGTFDDIIYYDNIPNVKAWMPLYECNA